MGADLSFRDFRPVERGIEEALRNFTRGQANGDRSPATAAHEPIDKIGEMSASAIAEICETTASEIDQTGQAVVEIAHEIKKEAERLAGDLRASEKWEGMDFAVTVGASEGSDTAVGVETPNRPSELAERVE